MNAAAPNFLQILTLCCGVLGFLGGLIALILLYWRNVMRGVIDLTGFLIRKCIIMHLECIRKPLQRRREKHSRLQVAARAFYRFQDSKNRSNYPAEVPIPRSGRYTGEWVEDKHNRSTTGKKEKTYSLIFDWRGTVIGSKIKRQQEEDGNFSECIIDCIRGHYNKERGRFLWGEGVRSDLYNDPHDYYNAIADLEALRSHAEFESIDYDDSTGILKARIYATNGDEGPATFTLENSHEGPSNAV